MRTNPTWVYNDGGRKAAGYSGATGDCVTRAIAIATGISYEEVYAMINLEAAKERRVPSDKMKRRRTRSHARTGVHRATYGRVIERRLGWKWTPTMGIGTGCQVHLKASELPGGHLIVRTSKHLCAVVDGVIFDTHDPSRGGTRCVYGYWSRP